MAKNLDDGNKINIKYKHALRRTRHTAISQFFRNPEASSFAFNHQLNALGPAGNHLIEAEINRCASDNARVEHGAICRPTRVMDAYAACGCWVCRTCTCFENLRSKARGCKFSICRRSCDIFGRFNGFGFGVNFMDFNRKNECAFKIFA